MGFFADVIALAPAVFWEADETSGTAIADTSGNGRTGTLTGAVALLNQASIIPNEASAGSINLDGTDVFVERVDEAALDAAANFTAIVAVRPTSLAAQRDIIGKLNSWQLWLETTGQLQGHISPAWTSFTSSNDAAGKLVINTNYLIGIRQNAVTGKASLWKNGVKVGEVNKATTLTNTTGQLRMGGSSTAGGRSFLGRAAAFAYWPTVALSDADMLALYNSYNTLIVSTAPDAPDITAPLEDAVVDRSVLVTLSDVSGTGSNGTLEYMVEFEQETGAGWQTLIDWTQVRPDNQEVDLRTVPVSVDFRLRAFARRSPTEVSGASEIITITLVHESLVNIPVAEWVWHSDQHLGFQLSPFSSSVEGAFAVASHWEIDADPAFPAPLEFSREGALVRLGVSNIEQEAGDMLLRDSDYYARGRYEDDIGGFSVFSEPVRARTSRNGVVLISTAVIGEDLSGNGRHMMFGRLGPVGGAVGEQHNGLRFPAFSIPDLGLAEDDRGVMHGHEDVVAWVPGHGSALPSGQVEFGVWLRGYMFQRAPINGIGIFGLAGAGAIIRVFQRNSNQLIAFDLNGGASPGEIITALSLQEDAIFDLRLTLELVEPASCVIKLNGVTVHNGVRPAAFEAPTKCYWGHHSGVGPIFFGAFHCLFGVLTHGALWWGAGAAAALEGLDLLPTQAEVIATAPVMYHRFGQPPVPGRPAVSQ